MQKAEKSPKNPRAFNITDDTFAQIIALADAEEGGNKSLWVQKEFDKIIASRKAERDAG